MEKFNKLPTVSITQFLSIFSNMGQVLDFGQLLIDQLKNIYSVVFIEDSTFQVDALETRTEESEMEILKQK